MKYGIKALMARAFWFCGRGTGALAAPASGKAAVNKENVQASSSAKAEAVPGESDNGATKVSINRASAEQLAQALNGVGLKKPGLLSATAKSTGRSKPSMI